MYFYWALCTPWRSLNITKGSETTRCDLEQCLRVINGDILKFYEILGSYPRVRAPPPQPQRDPQCVCPQSPRTDNASWLPDQLALPPPLFLLHSALLVRRSFKKIEFELLPQRKMTPLPLLLYGVAPRGDLRARGPPVRRGIRSHNIPIPHTHERCNSTRRKSRPRGVRSFACPVSISQSEKTFFFISVLRFRKCMCGRQVHLAREIAVVQQKILFGPPTYVMHHFIWQCNDTSHRGIYRDRLIHGTQVP